MARRLQPSPTQPQGGPLGKGAAPSSLAIPLWRACQSLPTGFSGPSFVTEWNEDSKRALGFELGGKRGSDDGKAVLVGFRDDPPLADGSLGVEPDRHGALRHVLRPLSLLKIQFGAIEDRDKQRGASPILRGSTFVAMMQAANLREGNYVVACTG